MDLLKAHKVLITFTLLLGLVLSAWGLVHGVYRHEPHALAIMVLGAMIWPTAGLYLMWLSRNPPLR